MRHLGLVRGQPVDLGIAVHGVPQAQARAQLQIARLEHALQQQDRAAPVQGAQALGLGDLQHGKAIGRTQALEGMLHPMAIGIRLGHAQQLGVRRGAAHLFQVVAQGLGVDGGENGARHGEKFPEGKRQAFWHRWLRAA